MCKFRLCTLIFIYSSIVFATEVSIPFRSIPEKVDILKLRTVDENRLASLVTSQLITVNDNFEFLPSLARRYWWGSEGKVLFLELKQSYFSDGSRVSTNDVLSSLRRCIKASETTLTSMFRYLVGYDKFRINGKGLGVSAPLGQKNIVKLSFVKKTPLILENLAHSSCSILKENGFTDLLSGAVSPGVYKVSQIKKDEIIFSKNKFIGKTASKAPDIVKAVATANYMNIDVVKEFSSLIESGKIISSLETKYNRYDYSFLGSWQISFNNLRLANREIRKALTLAINKRSLASEIGWSSSRLQSSIIPFGMRGFERDDLSRYSSLKAEALLTSLGYTDKKPLALTLLVKSRGDRSDTAKTWNRAFKLKNLKIKVLKLSGKAYLKAKNSFDFDMLYHGKAPGSMEPQILLNTFSSKSIYNTANIKVGTCDSLIEQSSLSLNLDERYRRYKKAEKCLLDEYVIIPLASVKKKYLYLKKPWVLTRSNQFLLYPYRVHEWRLKGE